MEYLTCKNLSLGYDSVLISDLNFTVHSGDYLCIVGENGAGKSTLVKTLLGLNKPLKGTVEWGDSGENNHVGYLTQKHDLQRGFPASVNEVVMSGFIRQSGFNPFYTAKQRKVAHGNMQRLGIENLAKRCYSDLSGGQQQRVLLARALCATEKALFLDEPVAGLDSKVSYDMYQVVKKLNDDGVTIIMVSHDINASLHYASHILQLGKETFFGTASEYIATKQHEPCIICNGGESNE